MDAPKYLIIDDEIIFGYVNLHYELIEEYDERKPIGGGWFHIAHKNKRIYLYFKSYDFGSHNKEALDKIQKITFRDESLEIAKDFEILYTSCYARNMSETGVSIKDME